MKQEFLCYVWLRENKSILKAGIYPDKYPECKYCLNRFLEGIKLKCVQMYTVIYIMSEQYHFITFIT